VTIVEGRLASGPIRYFRGVRAFGCYRRRSASRGLRAHFLAPIHRNAPVGDVARIGRPGRDSQKQTPTSSRAACFRRDARHASSRPATSDMGPLPVSLDMAQVEPSERRFGHMAQKKPTEEGRLTPERAREGHRWVRLTVLAAVVQAWMIAAVVALSVPHLLALSLACGAAYSSCAASAPLPRPRHRSPRCRRWRHGRPRSLCARPSPGGLSMPPSYARRASCGVMRARNSTPR
jgi:hypothetical protein